MAERHFHPSLSHNKAHRASILSIEVSTGQLTAFTDQRLLQPNDLA
jgi:hypothetical protein